MPEVSEPVAESSVVAHHVWLWHPVRRFANAAFATEKLSDKQITWQVALRLVRARIRPKGGLSAVEIVQTGWHI